jgi:hypothetical protein
METMISMAAMIACFFAPLLHNKYQKVPEGSYSYFIIGVKLISAVSCAFIARNWSSAKPNESENKKLDNDKSEGESKVQETESKDLSSLTAETIQAVLSEDRVVSFSKAFIKLSLSMFMVSMFYIRLDYFTSRLLFSVSAYDAVSHDVTIFRTH